MDFKVGGWHSEKQCVGSRLAGVGYNPPRHSTNLDCRAPSIGSPLNSNPSWGGGKRSSNNYQSSFSQPRQCRLTANPPQHQVPRGVNNLDELAADVSRRIPASINPIDHRATRSTGPVRPISNTLPLPLPCSPTKRGTGSQGQRERGGKRTKTQSPGNPVRASPSPSDVPSFASEPFVHAQVCRVPNYSPYRLPLA